MLVVIHTIPSLHGHIYGASSARTFHQPSVPHRYYKDYATTFCENGIACLRTQICTIPSVFASSSPFMREIPILSAARLAVSLCSKIHFRSSRTLQTTTKGTVRFFARLPLQRVFSNLASGLLPLPEPR